MSQHSRILVCSVRQFKRRKRLRVAEKKDIKDREIQLYRKYRSEMAINPGIDSHTDIRMRKMLKKIDRKIDERLTSVIK